MPDISTEYQATRFFSWFQRHEAPTSSRDRGKSRSLKNSFYNFTFPASTVIKNSLPYRSRDRCITTVPPKHLRGGHRMTLYAWARPRRFPQLSAPVPRYFDVSSDTRVLGHCHWKDEPKHHPTLIALHGLEGSSRAHYYGRTC